MLASNAPCTCTRFFHLSIQRGGRFIVNFPQVLLLHGTQCAKCQTSWQLWQLLPCARHPGNSEKIVFLGCILWKAKKQAIVGKVMYAVCVNSSHILLHHISANDEELVLLTWSIVTEMSVIACNTVLGPWRRSDADTYTPYPLNFLPDKVFFTSAY